MIGNSIIFSIYIPFQYKFNQIILIHIYRTENGENENSNSIGDQRGFEYKGKYINEWQNAYPKEKLKEKKKKSITR
jgi:hypothetical protein